MEKRLNHFNKNGEVHMVDVGEKPFSSRVAIAKGEISMAQTTLKVICDGLANKGDVLGTARLAGIMAAKNTSSLIPLCHPIHITKVSLDLLPNKKEKKIEIIALLSSIWFVISLPLPWLVITPDVAYTQLVVILQMTALISVPFIALAVAWTLKPELATNS